MLPEETPETPENKEPSQTPRNAHQVGDVNVLDLSNRVDRLTTSIEGLSTQLDGLINQGLPTSKEVQDFTTQQNTRLDTIERNVTEINQALLNNKKVPQEATPGTTPGTTPETSKETSNPVIVVDTGDKKPLYKYIRKRGGRVVTRLVKG